MSTDPTPTPPSSVVGRQDLRTAFGPTTRTSGLAGRLRRSTPEGTEADTDASSTPLDVEPGQQADAGVVPEVPKRRPAGERAAKTPAKARTEPQVVERAANTNYPVHVPADLVPLFNDRRDEQGTSNTLLVFDAIDSLVDHDASDPYARLREAARADVIGAQPSSLFARTPRRARPTTDRPRARSQIMLRMSEENRAVVEQLVNETGALDRSHLVTIALTHYLSPPTTR